MVVERYGVTLSVSVLTDIVNVVLVIVVTPEGIKVAGMVKVVGVVVIGVLGTLTLMVTVVTVVEHLPGIQ